ncbi:uncharacterized protein G2W53_004616 [Senna tora]|uniref:Uncharacterized protein n=1 Tax=Senna tora TaxID=362788 RepID=A0A834XBF2_9FABA|nr:uncharacterized protein G2W53_004616 [Senna tora]
MLGGIPKHISVTSKQTRAVNATKYDGYGLGVHRWLLVAVVGGGGGKKEVEVEAWMEEKRSESVMEKMENMEERECPCFCREGVEAFTFR